MAKNLKLGDLAAQIVKIKDDLDSAKTVTTKDMGGQTVKVSATNVKAAVAALNSAETKLSRLCQQGVFGVRVS